MENLSKNFGAIPAVNNISASFRPGKLTVLAGEDGSGKSTFLKMLIGLVKPDNGNIYLGEEQEPVNSRMGKMTAISGYMPERFSLYTDLSVEENMNFFADIQGVTRMRREELKQKLLKKTGMWEFRKRRAGALSGGMKQKLALSTILLSSPEIIILDEPTTGVDPLSRIEFFRIIDELKQEGRTIITSTPYLEEAEKGDDIFFLKQGRIIKRGSIGKLKKEFPARIILVLPDGPVFEALAALVKIPEIKDKAHVRGRHIKIMIEKDIDIPDVIASMKISEVPATLEDIFLYYERNENVG